MGMTHTQKKEEEKEGKKVMMMRCGKGILLVKPLGALRCGEVRHRRLKPGERQKRGVGNAINQLTSPRSPSVI